MPSITELKASAKKHFENLEYAESLAVCEKVIELEPGDPRNWLKAANNLQCLGRCKESLPYCDKAIGLDPENPLSFVCKAISLAELGRVDDVISNCGVAISLSPCQDEALAYRGAAFAKRGLHELSLHVEYLGRGNKQGASATADQAIAEFKMAIMDLSSVQEDNEMEQALVSSLVETIDMLEDEQPSMQLLEEQSQTLESMVK